MGKSVKHEIIITGLQLSQLSPVCLSYTPSQKTRYGTYVMLLRAKIRSGEEDLSVFESQLLEDNGLQRAHSSPTLQDSSQASQISQASSARDGGNSSKASACSSSKPRQEGQRHSYRQAVKKWDGAGAPGAAQRCTASGRLSPCRGFYLRSRRVRSSAWRGSRGEGLPPRPPPNHDALPGTPIFSSTRGGLGNTSKDVGAGGGRIGWEVTGLQRRGVFENVRWVQQQTELCTEIKRVLTLTRAPDRDVHPASFPLLPFCSFKAPLRPRSPTFFLDLSLSFGTKRILKTSHFRRLMSWFQLTRCHLSDLKRCNSRWTRQTSQGVFGAVAFQLLFLPRRRGVFTFHTGAGHHSF